jgi:hypothetical protein
VGGDGDEDEVEVEEVEELEGILKFTIITNTSTWYVQSHIMLDTYSRGCSLREPSSTIPSTGVKNMAALKTRDYQRASGHIQEPTRILAVLCTPVGFEYSSLALKRRRLYLTILSPLPSQLTIYMSHSSSDAAMVF